MFDAPVLIVPRLDPKPWAGDRLAGLGFARSEGVEPFGEALLTHGDAIGQLSSGDTRSLASLATEAPERYVGARGAAVTGAPDIFPFLVKFIDAAADLSIQLHPDDVLAREQGEPTGKTEAWHVLAAEPDARLYLGLAEDADPNAFLAAAEAGDPAAAAMLRSIPAEPGTTVVIPAGTVHALGSGVLIYEIQQPSNTTYRLYDWGRLDHAGNPRELHHALGRRALVPSRRPEAIAPVPMPTWDGHREMLAATRGFALERIVLRAGNVITLPADPTPQSMTCLGGIFKIISGHEKRVLQRGETAVVPAGVVCQIENTMPGVLLRGWTPDLPQDVIRPARDAGATDAEIAALAGELDDISALL
ncbi:MAG: class I mannose-6-phosphate isomerase [Thermomicrobiales bacterium]